MKRKELNFLVLAMCSSLALSPVVASATESGVESTTVASETEDIGGSEGENVSVEGTGDNLGTELTDNSGVDASSESTDTNTESTDSETEERSEDGEKSEEKTEEKLEDGNNPVNSVGEGDLGDEQIEETSEEVQVISSWVDYKFEEKSKPADGSSLVYADSYSLGTTPYDNLYNFVLSDGSYKILSYSSGIVYGFGTASTIVPADEEFGNPEHEYVYETLVAYSNPVDSTIESILANEPVRMSGSNFKTCADTEGYILFFNESATDISGLEFVCKVADLNNYLTMRGSSYSAYASSTAVSSVALLEKIYDAGTDFCTTGKFKIDFSLGNANISGVEIEEKAMCVVIDNDYNISLSNLNSGEAEFTLKNLENKTYSYYIKSSNGFKYEGSFTVDFVKVSDNSNIEVSDLVPEVSFEGYPAEPVLEGTSVTMKMNTGNIDSIMVFNGKPLGNEAYGRSFSFTVTQNGEYFYAATTESGRLMEGYLTIDFFYKPEVADLEDPINMPLRDAHGVSELVQTGIFGNVFMFVLAGISIVSGVLILLDRKFHFTKLLKKGGLGVDEKQ